MNRLRRHGRMLQALAGVGIGCMFLWLAFRDYEIEDLRDLALTARGRWIAAALAVYLATMAVRSLRWHLLLRRLDSRIRLPGVAETLVLGYAVNNVLPARLGELFRADYAKRRLGISRSEVLGSIVIERALDGATVVGFLWLGLLLSGAGAGAQIAQRALLWQVAGVGAGLFGLLFLVMLLIGRGHRMHFSDRLPAFLGRRLSAFRRSIAGVGLATASASAGMSPLVWLGEAAALWCVLRSLEVSLGAPAAMVITGAVSLSTLIPTAPGYLGTFQYAFFLALSAVGGDGATGVVAATLTQVFLFGSVVLAGAVIYLWRQLRPPAMAGP